MNKYSILVVEDEALIAANLVQILSSLGYTVHKPVATGEDAIRAVKTQHPDLVLMDIKLIGAIDGIEAAEKIRAIADIPIVYLTAYTDDLRLKKAQLTEPYGYIVKPTHSRELHATIEMAMYKHALDRKLKESEAKYRTLFENAVVGFFRTAPDGKLTGANMAYAKMYGYQDPDSVVREISNIGVQLYANVDDRNKILATLAAQGYLEPTEVQVRHRDGHLFWVSVTARTVRDAEGKILEYEGTNVDVTERKRAEEALRKERDFAHSVVGTAQAIVLILDPNGHIVYLNSYMEKISGYTLEEVKGKDWFETFLPSHIQESSRSLFRKAIGNTQTRGNIDAIITKDGRERLIEWYDTTLKGADGSIEGLLAIGQDVTDRKKIEDALRKSEEKYRTLIDTLNEGIWVIDKEAVTTFVNLKMGKILGYTVEEMTGRSLFAFMDAEGRRICERNIERRQLGIKEQHDFEFLKKDGTRIYASLETTPVIGKDGEYLGAIAGVTDITERKRAVAALKESEEKYRQLFELEADAILLVDKETGNLVEANRVAESLYGYSREEFLHMKNTELSVEPDETRRATQEALRHIPVRYHRKKDGTIFPVEITVNILHWQGRQVHIAAIRDITERKRAEEALRLANKQLNLLSGITRHDILNQLLVLRGYLELSLDVIDKPEALKEFIKKEQQAANTIDEQITFTRDYQELGAAAPEWQNVNASIKGAVDQLQMRGIHVEPDPANPEVYADPLFEKVFYNLIDNALRYGGEQMKTIRVSSQESDTSLVIVCEDDGVGITAEDKKRLFTRGFGKNTGLGLFLSREILAITGITITENGVPGKGARFGITVPKGAYRFTVIESQSEKQGGSS